MGVIWILHMHMFDKVAERADGAEGSARRSTI